jgi:hypothetical protein
MNAKPNPVVARREGTLPRTTDLDKSVPVQSGRPPLRQDAATKGHCYLLLPIGHNSRL